MRVLLIDVDGHNFPNLALMKLSAWHKANGDAVFFKTRQQFNASPLEKFDRVYASKVFTFSPDLEYPANLVFTPADWIADQPAIFQDFQDFGCNDVLAAAYPDAGADFHVFCFTHVFAPMGLEWTLHI